MEDKKTAAPTLEQLEKRIAAVERLLEDSTIVDLKTNIEQIVNVVEARLRGRTIRKREIERRKHEAEHGGEPMEDKKTAAPTLEQLEKRIAAVERLLESGKVFVLKGAADIEEIVDAVEARLQVRPIRKQEEETR